MNVAIIGTGYVGLVTGTCLAEVGHSVVCMDRDAQKISVLQHGGVPIYEEGLDVLIERNVAAGRLRFTTELAEALAGAEALFLAIGTPQGEDGSADLSMILAAAEQIGAVMTAPLVIVQKSTCPVGTVVKVEQVVAAAQAARGVSIPFAVVSNPEFLREGSAVRDFMQPDRVVIGADDEAAGQLIASLYDGIAPPERIIVMDRASAELTKYAANAFLATKISFINDIANLCEIVGADVEQVRRGIGSDTRIGPAFLAAGIGYGGSCFPKDVKALLKTSHDNGHALRVVEAVEAVNRDQRPRQLEKIVAHFGGNLAGKRIAVWGVAFKPGTDDMREAPAIDLTRNLVELGAEVVAYDPVAMENARGVIAAGVQFAPDALACVAGADALVLVTEWPEFLGADLDVAGAAMAGRVLFDLRNGFAPARAAAAGFTYTGVGRAAKAHRNLAVL
jgi:UDPglucose 6-dehydrogenase